MSKFNRVEFGNNLKKARKIKGLSQENLAKAINKSVSTIARFESGKLSPSAEEISLICDELGINEYELFKSSNDKIVNTENNINPFKVKELYLYYQAYYPNSNSYKVSKFKIKIINKPEKCEVLFTDYKTNKIYMTGYILSDTNIAVFVFENYKEFSPRLEVTQIILNISNGIDDIMLGSLTCTNGQYVPSIRKCAISKKDIEITEELINKLKITDNEKNNLNKNEILYFNINNSYDYEN